MIKYQYLAEKSQKVDVRVKSPLDILPLVKRYRRYKQEVFIAISLDGAHQVIKVRVITIGIINRTLVHPREIFVGAIEDRAAGIIICHNHPSGSLEPSREDLDITKRLVDASNILQIPILDHIIIRKGIGFYSFLEDGKI